MAGGVRPDEGKATSSRLRGGQSDYLAANGVGCDRISLRRASIRRKFTPKQPGNSGNVG
jgi:hypothetical protein